MKSNLSSADKPIVFPYLLYPILIVIVYFHSLGNEFVFDDRIYLVDNPRIKNFDAAGILAIFTTFYEWDYLPLTHLSFWFEYPLFGLDPAGYHAVNALLHLINVFLLHAVVSRLSGCRTTAFWTALLFLLHPVHVESVAWISERKNVLSLFFLLLAFRSHLLQRSRWLPLGLYLLACLAKTSVVIFPLLLVLTDRCFTDKPFRRSVIDKLPYFLISLVVVIVALTSHAQGGTLRPHPGGNPFFTLLSMLVVFKEYLLKLLFPVNLNIWYPNPVARSLFQAEVLKACLVAASFAYLVRYCRKDRVIFFGLVWYLIALLPVSHLVPIPQMMADRFLYIPSIGLFLAAVTGLRRAMQGSGQWLPRGVSIVAAIVMLNYVALSHHRVFVYQDDFTLWSDSIRRNEHNTIAMMYLGLTYWGRGNPDTALEKLARAREIEPENFKSILYTALIHEEKKQYQKAEEAYLYLMQRTPEKPEPYNHLAVLYGNQGKLGKAILLLEKAVSLDPLFGLAYFNLGVFQYHSGNREESLAAHQQAVAVAPQNAKFHYQLGMFYLKNTDRPDLGRAHLETSLRLNPDREDADQIRALIKKQT